MMELLGKALDYYKTLIKLEERLNGTPVERVSKEVVVNSSQHQALHNDPISI